LVRGHNWWGFNCSTIQRCCHALFYDVHNVHAGWFLSLCCRQEVEPYIFWIFFNFAEERFFPFMDFIITIKERAPLKLICKIRISVKWFRRFQTGSCGLSCLLFGIFWMGAREIFICIAVTDLSPVKHSLQKLPRDQQRRVRGDAHLQNADNLQNYKGRTNLV